MSNCPEDTDQDGVIDALDIDWDNDGIENCTEGLPEEYFKYQTQDNTFGFDFNYNDPNLRVANGLLVTEPKNGNTITVDLNNFNYNGSTTLNLKILPSSNSGVQLWDNDDLLTISTTFDKVLTLYDPNDEILVDTDNDGTYEPGITQISSHTLKIRPREGFDMYQYFFGDLRLRKPIYTP